MIEYRFPPSHKELIKMSDRIAIVEDDITED